MKISIYNVNDTPIGRGGMGQVYLGTDPNGTRVAIKEMLAQYVTDTSLRQRFYQDIRILTEFEHPFIVKLYTSFEEHGNLYSVMEYVEGETLEQYVKRKGAMSENEAIRLTTDILSALAYVHNHKIVHRDIKPSNIMIRPDGNVCLIDFGIAKDLNRGSNDGLTKLTMAIGTVGYMSPEQAEGNSIDWRSDIYSLGCVLFYMLTGRHAIKEESNEVKTRLAVINNPFPAAKVYNPDISDSIQKILNKATDKNMLLRFQSSEDFRAELLNLVKKDDKKDNKNDALQEKLDIANQRLNAVEESKRKHKIAWVILLVICIILSIVSIYKYNEVDSLYSALYSYRYELKKSEENRDVLQKQKEALQQQKEALQQQFDNLRETFPIKITGITLGYGRSGNITYPTTLYSSQIPFLFPKIFFKNYLATGKTVNFTIKYYNASGTLISNYKYSAYISTSDTEDILSGWGSESIGVWKSGDYSVEIWVDDICLESRKFKIY